MIQRGIKKIILGIDPGIGNIGWGYIQSEKNILTCIAYGCIKTPPRTPCAERLFLLYTQLQTLLSERRPDIIAVEKIYFVKNITTGIEVSHARGVILLAAYMSGVPITEHTPLQVKQAVTGYGKAEKQQIQKMTQTILRIKEKPRPDDAADALAVAICASQIVL